MAQTTYLVRKGQDADLNNVTVAGTLTVTGETAYGETAWEDSVATIWGTGSDVSAQFDGTDFVVTAGTDALLIEWGDASATQKSFNQKFTGNAANGTDYLYFDCENNLLYTTGVDILVKDDDFLLFGSGSGGDVRIEWDTAGTPDALLVTALADDTLISVGNGTNDFDLKWSMSSGNYLTFDASASAIITTDVDMQFVDSDVLVFGTGTGITGDIGISYDGDSLNFLPVAAADVLELGADSHVLNTTLKGTLTVGKDDTGHDVTFYGATSGCSMLWDESEDQLVITGPADVPALKLAGAGSISAAGWAAAGAAWADSGVTPAFVEDQMFMLVDVGGTVYRIPLWANA